MPLPTPIYTSGDFTTVVPVGIPVFSSPIPGVNTPYVVKQEFMQHAESFSPQALNTTYDLSFATASTFEEAFTGQGLVQGDFVLVEESERERMGVMVRWTRTYAKIPAAHKQPTSFSYRFIQFYFPEIINGTTFWSGIARPPFQETVNAEIVFEYFLIANGGSMFDVPEISAFAYYSNQANSVERNIFTEFLLQTSYAAGPTVPSIDEYLGMMLNETPIVAQPSTIQRWMGNIIERQTIYILPK